MASEDWLSASDFFKSPKRSWDLFFKRLNEDLIHKNNMKRLEKHIRRNPTFAVFPNFPDVLRVFNTNPQDIKVVILGQDPYHNYTKQDIPQAMGLSFSVPPKTPHPPSLRNIFKELKETIPDFKIPESGDLTSWAEQGVFLLNSSLTVHHNNPNGHQKYWEHTTSEIIKELSLNYTNIVFMLWGTHAKNKEVFINYPDRHKILKASHPSPLSANKGGWFGTNHFNKANKYLKEKNKTPINWNL